MGANSLPKTVTRQRRDCSLNLGPSAPESSTLATRLPSHPLFLVPSFSSFLPSGGVVCAAVEYAASPEHSQLSAVSGTGDARSNGSPVVDEERAEQGPASSLD